MRYFCKLTSTLRGWFTGYESRGGGQHVQRAGRATHAGMKHRISEQILHCKRKLFWGCCRCCCDSSPLAGEDTKPWPRSGLGGVGEGDWSIGQASRGAIALRPVHFFITQRRKGAKKVLAQPVILETYFGDGAPVDVIQPNRRGGV